MDTNQHECKGAENVGPDNSLVSIRVNSWFYSLDHHSICQVIETQTLWGETTWRVWLPVRDHRLNFLAKEEQDFQNQLDQKARLYPEMTPLLIVRVEENHE